MEREIIIDTEEIEKYFFKQLVAHGFAPGTEECEVLADIVFDYLAEIGVIEEFDEY